MWLRFVCLAISPFLKSCAILCMENSQSYLGISGRAKQQGTLFGASSRKLAINISILMNFQSKGFSFVASSAKQWNGGVRELAESQKVSRSYTWPDKKVELFNSFRVLMSSLADASFCPWKNICMLLECHMYNCCMECDTHYHNWSESVRLCPFCPKFLGKRPELIEVRDIGRLCIKKPWYCLYFFSCSSTWWEK